MSNTITNGYSSCPVEKLPLSQLVSNLVHADDEAPDVNPVIYGEIVRRCNRAWRRRDGKRVSKKAKALAEERLCKVQERLLERLLPDKNKLVFALARELSASPKAGASIRNGRKNGNGQTNGDAYLDKNAAKRYSIVDAFARNVAPSLLPYDVAVWLALWALDKGGYSKASLRDLARRCNVSTTIVAASLARLIGRRLIVRKFVGRGSIASVYELTACPAEVGLSAEG